MDLAPTEVPGLLLQGKDRLRQLWKVMQEPVYWALPTGHRKLLHGWELLKSHLSLGSRHSQFVRESGMLCWKQVPTTACSVSST